MLMNYALKYAAEGSAVFPCRPRGKEPLGKLVPNGCLDATTDIETIKRWWSECPDANIGMATGSKSKIIAVDLDGMEGITSGVRLGLHSNIISLTGNGKQLFYAAPDVVVKNSVKKVALGVDIRGENGYVVVPPSLHPSGKRYLWQTQFLKRDLLKPLPSIFLSSELKNNESTLRKIRPPEWIDEAIKRLQEGHVANTLISVLGKFRSANFTEDATYTLLKPYALVDGKPFEGLRDKIAEIWQRYGVPTQTGSTEDVDEFLSNKIEVDWICKPFFAKKSIGFVAGLPETMKTWLLVDLVLECARGSGLWLGRWPISQEKVLFIDQERSREETQRRFDAMIAAKNITRAELKGKLFIKNGTTIRLNLEESFQAFRREMLDLRPSLVVVDSFKSFHTAAENDSSEMQKVVEKIRLLRNEFDCAFIFIHHENKGAYPNGEPQGEPHMGTLSGSTAIPAAAENCLVVRKVEEGTSMVWHVKSTQAKKANPFYTTIKDVDSGIEVQALAD